MAAAAAAEAASVTDAFVELERQRDLIANCTALYKQLSDHFATLDRAVAAKSEALAVRRRALDSRTARALDSLRRRDASIEDSVSAAVARVDQLAAAQSPAAADGDVAGRLKSLCAKMDASGFWQLVVSNRKEADLLRSVVPPAILECIDPAKFVMDAISDVFPVDKRTTKNPGDLSWACVLVLEAAVPALSDPEFGTERPLVPKLMRDRAREMAREWKEGLEKRGGVEGAKPPDAHAFLQHVVSFGIVEKDDKDLYRKLVVNFSWRRQMPRLAISVGLEDEMIEIIEELIAKGQQLDAVNFAFETGLQNNFPPVPLLNSFLEDSKISPNLSPASQGSGQAGNNAANKREQAALRAVIKCVEDHKLEADYPLEGLQKQLEELEKAKVEKKKAASSNDSGAPANKRTRVNNGGPMPPAKAGRLTSNAYVSSFPAAAVPYVRSPSHSPYAAAAPYPYDMNTGHNLYGNLSPPTIGEPYAYAAAEEVPAVGLGMAYQSPPMSYAPYGGYSNGLAAYNTGLAPAFHRVYYQ